MTCARFSLNSRNRSASGVLLHNPHRSSASEHSWRTSFPQTPFIGPPPYPISKYATAPCICKWKVSHSHWIRYCWRVKVSLLSTDVSQGLVSNAKLTEESLQFHERKRSTVISAIMSPNFQTHPGWFDDAPRNFISFAFLTRTARRSSPTLLVERDSICFESQCRFASFGTPNCSLTSLE